MSEAPHQFFCITCERQLPAGTKDDDAPKYFVQHPLFPRPDHPGDFLNEGRQITGYIKAIAYVCHYGENKEIPEAIYNEIFSLLEELSEEADRRFEHADQAIRMMDKQLSAKKRAAQEEA